MSPLHEYGFSSKFVGNDGKGHLGVLCVGEAPGEHEDLIGKPLQGPSGKLFDRMVTRSTNPASGRSLERNDLLITNAVNYRPPNNELAGTPYESLAIEHCRPYLEATIRESKPRAILAMGATAIKWFIEHATEVKDWRGYAVHTKYGWVVPTYHPAFLLRGNFALCEAFQYDLLRAVQIASNGGTFPRAPVEYNESPTVAEAWQYLETYKLEGGTLGFDIETPYSGQRDDLGASEFLREKDDPSYTIVRISFSRETHTAISMPWIGEYVKVAKALLETKGPKAVWNEAFDVPRLRANHVVVGGDVRDFMWAWHFWKPHLPYGLKYAATFLTDLPQWKHESATRPAWYSCVDSDALIRCAVKLERLLRGIDRWDLFLRHVVDVSKVLRQMSLIGIPTDGERRKLVRAEMEKEYLDVSASINKEIPLDMRRLKVYKSSRATLEKKGLLAKGEWVEVDDGLPEPEPKKKGAKHPVRAQAVAEGAEEGKENKAPKRRRNAKSVPDSDQERLLLPS
jgi:DNA polymerase